MKHPALPADDSWSFAIATPDAIATGRLDELLAILRAHGFTVLPLPAFPPEEIDLSPLEATALDAHRRS